MLLFVDYLPKFSAFKFSLKQSIKNGLLRLIDCEDVSTMILRNAIYQSTSGNIP